MRAQAMRRGLPRRVAALLLLGLAARAAYGGLCWVRRGGELPDPDAYVALASSFARTGELRFEGRPSALREPVYPVLLGAAFRLLGEGYATVLLVNLALGAGVLWLLYRLGRGLWDERAGLVALGIGALYPAFVYYSAQPLRETAMAFMALLSIRALCLARAKADARAFAGAGVVCALAGLTNTTFVPFGLVLAPLGVLALDRLDPAKRSAPLRWRWAAAFLAAFAAVYSLWPARNYARAGGWILGSTAGAGSTFYTYLLVPQEEGGTRRQSEILSGDPVSLAGASLPPAERERYFWRAGADYVRRHPWRYARLVAWRTADLWRPLPRPRSYEHSYALLRWVSLASDGWIIPMGLLGILLARLRPPELAWLYGLVASVNLVYALILTMIRYRFSLMPFIILLAAFSLVRAWDAAKGRMNQA